MTLFFFLSEKMFILTFESQLGTTRVQELSVFLLSLLLRKGEPAESMSNMHNSPHVNSILVVLQYIITCKWIPIYYKNNYPYMTCLNRFIVVASDQGSNLFA